jgi:hypothetical protein
VERGIGRIKLPTKVLLLDLSYDRRWRGVRAVRVTAVTQFILVADRVGTYPTRGDTGDEIQWSVRFRRKGDVTGAGVGVVAVLALYMSGHGDEVLHGVVNAFELIHPVRVGLLNIGQNVCAGYVPIVAGEAIGLLGREVQERLGKLSCVGPMTVRAAIGRDVGPLGMRPRIDSPATPHSRRRGVSARRPTVLFVTGDA